MYVSQYTYRVELGGLGRRLGVNVRGPGLRISGAGCWIQGKVDCFLAQSTS
jgi:hypothetical protein